MERPREYKPFLGDSCELLKILSESYLKSNPKSINCQEKL